MTAEDRLKARVEQMRADGLINFHITPGPAWDGLSREQRCDAILNLLDAKRIPCEPPKTGRPQVNLRQLVENLP